MKEATATKRSEIVLRPVGLGDLVHVVARGVADFRAAPLVGAGIAAIYAVGGWVLIVCLVVLDLPYLVYPLAMGFALIAPFVAVAFYDVSRRLEMRVRPTLPDVWRSVREAGGRDLRWMALITAFAFFLWMDMAAMLTLAFFGATALDVSALATEILTTGHGWLFLAVGHVVGAIIALLIFSISAVSFPMLFDRDVDVMTAMMTSVRLVRRNPVAMAVWCVVIALSMGLSIASGLVLLPVVLPVLGFASWHLYRFAVVTG